MNDVETTKSSKGNQNVEPNYHQYTLFDIGIDPGLKDDEGNEIPRPFTKNQMRKWLKRARWVNHKADKRMKEKQRLKERRREAREANIDLGPSRKALKKMILDKAKKDVGIIVDLSFDNLMIEKDRYKVIKQILRCYSVNRRSNAPVHFHITSFGETSKVDISRHNGYENWDVEFHEVSYLDLFPKEKLVYLTSESENVIENFEEDTYYIIGGLVDHNQHKGLCHSIAIKQDIRHGRLPLDRYINMKTRKVLTIDHGITVVVNSEVLPPIKPSGTSFPMGHQNITPRRDQHPVIKTINNHVFTEVFEIILKVCEGMSWQDTLMKVLPIRKGAHICDNNSVDVSYQSDNL